jgi:hypothetical protein
MLGSEMKWKSLFPQNIHVWGFVSGFEAFNVMVSILEMAVDFCP